MNDWNAKEFAKDIRAGKLNGRLNEELAKLSKDQLEELIRVMAARDREQTK